MIRLGPMLGPRAKPLVDIVHSLDGKTRPGKHRNPHMNQAIPRLAPRDHVHPRAHSHRRALQMNPQRQVDPKVEELRVLRAQEAMKIRGGNTAVYHLKGLKHQLFLKPRRAAALDRMRQRMDPGNGRAKMPFLRLRNIDREREFHEKIDAMLKETLRACAFKVCLSNQRAPTLSYSTCYFYPLRPAGEGHWIKTARRC